MDSKTTERDRLSKEAVVDRALTMADEGGLESVTIRKLAQSLGVTPMALYWHFHSKEELLDGLAERVWSELDLSLRDEEPWTEQFRGLMGSLVRVLRAHPAAPSVFVRYGKRNESSLRAMEVSLEVLRGAGFDPDNAAEITRAALWTGISLVMSEPGQHPGLSEQDWAEERRRDLVQLSLLPASRFPRIVECAVPLTSCDDPDFHYRLGIDMFVAGVKAVAPHEG
jgi:TetR/AcrR family transcriptional regulator, tetracycline repressor protein